jgi:hypothetical protein
MNSSESRLLRATWAGILFGFMALLIVGALADIIPGDVAAMFVAVLAFAAAALGIVGRRRR